MDTHGPNAARRQHNVGVDSLRATGSLWVGDAAAAGFVVCSYQTNDPRTCGPRSTLPTILAQIEVAQLSWVWASPIIGSGSKLVQWSGKGLSLTIPNALLRMGPAIQHRLGRDPATPDTEGANPAKTCIPGVKLSGKRTQSGRSSGKSTDTEGANRFLGGESLRSTTEGAHRVRVRLLLISGATPGAGEEHEYGLSRGSEVHEAR